jgi:PAS domain S-box-containing protein
MFTKEIYEKTEGQPSMAQLPIPIATFDTHFRFLSYSDVWLKTHHTSNDNLIGQVLFDTLPNLPLKFKTTLINNLKSKNNNHYEQKFTRPDGTSIWYSWKLDFLGKKDGAIDGITLILNDCSHRLGYDELLSEAQEVSRTGGWQVNLVNFEVLWTQMVNIIHEEPLDYVPLTFATPGDLVGRELERRARQVARKLSQHVDRQRKHVRCAEESFLVRGGL